MAKSTHYYIRRSHRYLGILLGIQFLFWTLGGLYFSWTNIDEIHGDLQHIPAPLLKGGVPLASPDSVLKKAAVPVDSIQSIQLQSLLGKLFWRITYFSGGKMDNLLADAQTARIRPAINREEAIQIAQASFNGKPMVKTVAYLTSTTGHHEYREKPLPAWAVTFNHPTQTTVYVSAAFGKVESFRNNKWRVFDFLWMMHTMDYKGRDNINNGLLRAFSLFGLLTILSGFALYWISRRKRRRIKNTLVPIRTTKP